ncbi:MAG: asparagine synthase (glutamine-hydrolyzing) [Solirubrobacteraceae bacterium]|nr:asparagine synthase (glutamine-hydrolyzing) [Solirubrobacteraceae bacterium]
MCGICGLLSLDGSAPVDPAQLGAMCAAIAHRGPDGEGTYVDGPVGLGARRLALVDVEHGAQPVGSEDGAIQVVLNGEIYNHGALRRGLERRGHRFATHCDTEVLAHLYEEHGPRMMEQLRGMFAFAIWDGRARRLLLARDRFGIKPLLYALDDRRLAFASELKALLRLSDIPRDLDPDALTTYLAVNAVPAPMTMLRAVRKLPAGHLLIAERGGVRIERWATDLPAAADALRHEDEHVLAEELRERLRDSVRMHLRADVPVGVLLSGGVDSGVIAALAAEETPRLQTFTVGFRERSFDELVMARTVAERLGTDHHELIVEPGDADVLPDVARSMDEPRGDATALPYWLAARRVSGSRKAVLSGEGGDELFAGYQTYAAGGLGAAGARAAALVAPVVARLPSSSRRLSLDFRVRRLALGAGLGPLERHHAFKEILSAAQREAVAQDGRLGSADPIAAHRRLYAEAAAAPPIARLQHVDLGTFLADDLLTQADRAGMAHGVEVRVPFLDPAVAEFARALPDRCKVRGMQTKRLLRLAAAPLVPRDVAEGPKRGFVAPAAAWLRGELEPVARDILGRETLERQGMLRPEAVTAMLDRHAARREDLSRPLWALMALTLWHDAVLGGAAPNDAQPPLSGVASAP